MSRLVMIAVTGLLALFLTACGEDSKPTEVKTETTVVAPQDGDATKSDEAGKAADTNASDSEKKSDNN